MNLIVIFCFALLFLLGIMLFLNANWSLRRGRREKFREGEIHQSPGSSPWISLSLSNSPSPSDSPSLSDSPSASISPSPSDEFEPEDVPVYPLTRLNLWREFVRWVRSL